MTETYTSGRWTVKPGEEDAFVQESSAFVTWASSMRVRSHCEDFEPSTQELVTEVE